MRTLILAASVTCLAGCASLSDPIQTGPGTYVIAGLDRGDTVLPTEMRLTAIKQAIEFCVGRHARYEPLAQPPRPGVAFRCV